MGSYVQHVRFGLTSSIYRISPRTDCRLIAAATCEESGYLGRIVRFQLLNQYGGSSEGRWSVIGEFSHEFR